MPPLEQLAPGALHLCHNQSGLRDYWAVAMLHGSPVEAPFGDTEAASPAPGRCSSHLATATPTSTRIFASWDVLQNGRAAELLRTRIFERAGMATALLAADTAMPDGTKAMRENATGAFARRNRIP